MHPLHRFSAWGSSTVGEEFPDADEKEKDQRHRHRHCRHGHHEKNYDTLPLGGNRPVATTAVTRVATAGEREKEIPKRHRRRREPRSESSSSASSLASGTTGSRSSRSSKKPSHRTEEMITGADKTREKRSPAGFAECEMDAGVSITYPHSLPRILSTPAASPTEPIEISGEPRRKGTDGSGVYSFLPMHSARD